MPNAPEKLPRRSRGNATVLLLVSSGLHEFAQVPETMLSALGHFGIPYRVHDLRRRRLDRRALDGSAAVVIGQENVGLDIDAATRRVLLEAVEDGLGLVNFDYNLTHYDDSMPVELGLAGAGGRLAIGAAESIGVNTVEHYLTYTQAPGAKHRLNMPVPALRTRATRGLDVLAVTQADDPAVVAGRIGRGRFVQWLVSPRLWMLRYFGHAHGLDDLFWKGIVWTARKPFAILAMPPYVRFRFDDCQGLYRTPEEFGFVDVLNEYGHKPNMCICMNAVEPESWHKLKLLQDAGKAEVAPHTWRGGVSLYYGDETGEYSSEQFRDLIRHTREILDRAGIRPSKILSDHEHEYSRNVLPYLSELGIEYKMNVMLPGETWAGMHVDWRPKPYGSMSYALDYTPGPYPLFVVFNHHPSFDFARSYVSGNRFLLNRGGGYDRHMWDFLNGLTERTLGKNDIEAMAGRLAEHTRLGLNSLFFGGSISHSHFTSSLSEGEWRAILDRYERMTERFEKINVGYDDICDHARSRFHTRIAGASRRGGGVSMRLRGEARTPLAVSVFCDDGDFAVRSYIDVAPFSGDSEVTQ